MADDRVDDPVPRHRRHRAPGAEPRRRRPCRPASRRCRAANPAALATPEAADAFLETGRRARVVVVAAARRQACLRARLRRAAARCSERRRAAHRHPRRPGCDLDLQARLHRAAEMRRGRLRATWRTAASPTCAPCCSTLPTGCWARARRERPPPRVAGRALYHPDQPDGAGPGRLPERPSASDRPTLGLLFYRAHWMSREPRLRRRADRRPLEARGLQRPAGLLLQPEGRAAEAAGTPRVFRRFLLDAAGAARGRGGEHAQLLDGQGRGPGADVATGWSVDFLDRLDVPILQAVNVDRARAQWQAAAGG